MRWASVAAALLAASTLFSGCLSGSGDKGAGAPGIGLPDVSTLSQAAFAILPPTEVWVTTSGDLTSGETGIRLHNAVFRPDTTEPVPVFINFSPYWDDSAMIEGDAFSQYMIREYVPRGYAVVLSAIRGTGHSEGCFEIGSDRELLDLKEVVDYFAAEPWSTGAVAAGGKSYDSTPQNGFVAKFPTPNLKGLFHVEGITDMYSYTFQNGLPTRSVDELGGSAGFQAYYMALQGLGEYVGGAAGAGSPADEDPDSLARLAGDAGCTEAPQNVANPGASSVAGAKTPYWVERDWTRSIATSSWNGSIFFVHGFQDWNVQPSHILPWIDQVNANGNIDVLGWLHQWTNGDEEGAGNDGHVYPMRTDWNETLLRWLDHILKGKDTGMNQLYGYDLQDTDLTWHHEAAWPPTAGIDLAGVIDDSALELGDGDVHLSGALRINLTAASTNADPVLTAVLYDVNGTTRTWVGEAALRGVFRDSLETPSAVPQGSAIIYRMQTYPLDHVVKAGHELVLDFGANPSHAVVQPTQMLGITYGTADVHIPIAGLAPIEPQPVWMKCFTC